MPTNEEIFQNYMNENWPAFLNEKVSWSRNNVSISTDFHIETENYIFLIEIDASNQAKLIAGQYLLINLLRNSLSKRSAKTFNRLNKPMRFIVIHFFNKYNPDRSFNNMRLVNNEALATTGIPFGSIHYITYIDQVSNFTSLAEFETFFEALL